MKLKAYAIYDRKGLFYNTPFFSQTDAMASRSFADVVNDPASMISRHPDDFILYLVGEYEDQTGQLTPVVPLIHVSDAVPLVRKPQRDYFANQPPQASTAQPNGEDR